MTARKFGGTLALLILAGILGYVAALAGRALLIPLSLLVAYILVMFGLHVRRDSKAVRQFRENYSAQGKDLLLVYSNSPNWARYIEEQWLPRWGSRAVILNWSERSQWPNRPAPEIALFRAVGGRQEFNPLAVVVPQHGHIRVVRFWRAFRDFKHGKDRALKLAEQELEEALSATRAAAA